MDFREEPSDFLRANLAELPRLAKACERSPILARQAICRVEEIEKILAERRPAEAEAIRSACMNECPHDPSMWPNVETVLRSLEQIDAGETVTTESAIEAFGEVE